MSKQLPAESVPFDARQNTGRTLCAALRGWERSEGTPRSRGEENIFRDVLPGSDFLQGQSVVKFLKSDGTQPELEQAKLEE